MNLVAILALAGGLACLAVAVFNPAVFYEHPWAAFLVDLLGRVGTRVFYLLVGLGLLYYGVPPG